MRWATVWFSVVEVAVLYANEIAVGVEVWNLQPVDAPLVAPARQLAPADDARVEMSLIEEKGACCRIEVRAVEETQILRRSEGGR